MELLQAFLQPLHIGAFIALGAHDRPVPGQVLHLPDVLLCYPVADHAHADMLEVLQLRMFAFQYFQQLVQAVLCIDTFAAADKQERAAGPFLPDQAVWQS